MAIEFIVTDAGRAEVLNSDQNGWGPVEITEIALGSGSWTPTPAATSLQSEIKRLTAIAGGASSPTILHVNSADRSTDDYEAFEVGLYLDSGTLFAIASQPIAIVSKSASSSAYVSADIEMTGQVTPAMVTFGDTNFVWNAASETVEGLVKLATDEDVKEGIGTGVVTAEQTTVFAQASETPDGVHTPGLPSGIYTFSAVGAGSRFGVLASKPGGSVFAAVFQGSVSGGSIAIQEKPVGSSVFIERHFFLPRSRNDERYLQQENNLSDLADASTARTNLGLAYATQVQAQDGVNNATAMTPLRTKQAIDEQRAINVGLVAGRVNFQRVSGSGVSMAQQFGTGTTNSGSTTLLATVSFGQSFSAPPVVTITPTSNAEAGVITSVSSTFASFTVTFKCDVAPASGIQFNWLAIGTVTT